MNFHDIQCFLRNKMLKQFFPLLFPIVLLLVFSCQSKVSSDIPPEIVEKKSIPQLDATDFETTLNDSGIIRYHLKTPRLLVFPEERNPKRDEYYEFPQGFHVQEYDQDRKIKSEMSGNYGKYYTKLGKWYASGNVVMINSKGDTLRTEELNYDQKKDLIYSDKFVSIRRGGQDFNGSGGFKSNSQMTSWTFMKTQGHVYIEDQ